MSNNTVPTSHTQTIFPLIAQGDMDGIASLLDTDPMLVHARLDDSVSEHPRHCHWSTLQFAAHTGQIAVCKLLVDRGAEVYTNPANTYPPVILAKWKKHQDVVDYFLNEIPDKADGTNHLGVAINLAAREGWIDIVRKHIEIDPHSVHYRGWIGDTPLHWPAHNGHIEIVRLLLKNGADPTQHEINWIGGTPLHWASEREPEICQMLIDAGADVNAQVSRPGSHHLGGTPLHWCARQPEDCAEAIEVLLKNGADPTILDAFGKTALDYSEERDHPRVAATLRAHATVHLT
jgi:cytohesin